MIDKVNYYQIKLICSASENSLFKKCQEARARGVFQWMSSSAWWLNWTLISITLLNFESWKLREKTQLVFHTFSLD